MYGAIYMDKATQVSIEALKRIRGGRSVPSARDNGTDSALAPTRRNPDRSGVIAWPQPKPLPNGLAPVESFSSDFVPDALGAWIDDIGKRLQCPPDYVAVAALTALGSVIGRRIGIRPQLKTDWVEVPNIWGMFIGRPGMLKSPAMGEALKPIHHLEAGAAKENEIAQDAYAAGVEAYELRKQVMKALARDELKAKKNTDAKVSLDFGEKPKEPPPIRYRTNDSTYEAIGELQIANPTGILVERDELVSLLKQLDRDEQAAARGFYLTEWSGTQPYAFDRIIRGHRHIEAVCISVLGNTQPARIAEYVRLANRGGAGGDGMMQRFSLLVWPDAPRDWRDIDQYPNSAAREKAWKAFDRMAKLDTAAALSLGAQKGPYDKLPSLRFEEGAHADFLAWRADLERRLRSGEMSPALEGHLAKYRKLVPSLALINHLADGCAGPVSHRALLKALAASYYLESHARRVYGSAQEAELAAAKAILKHIRNRDLADGFTARDVHQRGWAHLTEREDVGAGLSLLFDLDYLALSALGAGVEGGRPKVTHLINPRSLT
jgi:putative DNA primase/helicase